MEAVVKERKSPLVASLVLRMMVHLPSYRTDGRTTDTGL